MIDTRALVKITCHENYTLALIGTLSGRLFDYDASGGWMAELGRALIHTEDPAEREALIALKADILRLREEHVERVKEVNRRKIARWKKGRLN